MHRGYEGWRKGKHRALPQKAKGGKSPYEITTSRPPDDNVLFIHTFGFPCQYEPAYGVEHKRAAKTEWGWFVVRFITTGSTQYVRVLQHLPLQFWPSDRDLLLSRKIGAPSHVLFSDEHVLGAVSLRRLYICATAASFLGH
jgi:hypothetical protein